MARQRTESQKVKTPGAERGTGNSRQITPPQTWRERFAALRNVPPFLKLIWDTSHALTITSLTFRIIRAVLPVLTLYIGKLIIDDVIRLAGAPHNPTTWHDWVASGRLHRITVLVLSEFTLAIVADVLARVVGVTDALLARQCANATSIRLMKHAATLDLEDFEDSELQDRLERARQQASNGMGLMGQLFGQAQEVLTIATFAAGLIVLAPWLILLLAITLIPAFAGESYFNAAGYQLNFARSQQRRELEYIRYTGASVETAKEVKIFGLNTFLIERYKTLSDDFYDVNRALGLRRARWSTLFAMIGATGYYIAYAFIIWRALVGQFSVGDLTFLAGSFRRLRSSLEGLLSGFTEVAGQALYLNDLFSFFSIEPEIHSPGHPRPFPYPIQQGVVFENVGFKYPSATRWAVRHLNFTLNAGEIIALVGENGAGKTTLVKLLARLYDPDEGRILLDGHDLRDYDLDGLRGNLGVIFQDFMRYHLTAAENIAVGRIEARDDRPRIVQAAERSLAADVIGKLPDGYDQILGKRFQKGVDLSGGEWQKVAIARAYMRDAQLLILDEPTAALDARAEFQVFQRFKELSAGRSAVLISHRFSSVRMADRILVLADGELEASGTHQELLAQNGRYAELFELQAAGYR